MKKFLQYIQIILFIILTLSAFFIIGANIKKYLFAFHLKNTNEAVENISLNFVFDDTVKDKIDPDTVLICYNTNCDKIKKTIRNNTFNFKIDRNTRGFYEGIIRKVSLNYPKNENLKNNLLYLDIYIGNTWRHYEKNEIREFSEGDYLINFYDKEVKEYSYIMLPEINNYRGIINHTFVLLMSFFYTWQAFWGAYILFYFVYLIYFFNRRKLKFKVPYGFLLCLVFVFGFLIRLNDISYHPFWLDELYTKTVATINFKSTFLDPGNPPLFYILEYIFIHIFGNCDISYRILPLLFGALFPPLIYLLFKNTSKKEALLAAVLACVNLVNTYHAQEARAYNFCALLLCISIFVLFRYLKNPNNKNLIFYTITSILMCNTNYFLILCVFSNFICGGFYLFKNNKNELPKFLLSNIISFLTLIPYFIISLKEALSADFNGWIKEPAREVVSYLVQAYFLNTKIALVVLLLFIINFLLCIFAKNLVDKEKRQLFLYTSWTLFFVGTLAALISIFIKPIIHGRTVAHIYSLLFILEVLIVLSVIDIRKVQEKIKPLFILYSVILVCLVSSITSPLALRTRDSIQNYMDFISYFAPKYHDLGYSIYASIPCFVEYKNHYQNVRDLDYINWRVLKVNEGNQLGVKKDDFTNKNDKVLIFVNQLGVDFGEIYLNEKNLYIYLTNMVAIGDIIYN